MCLYPKLYKNPKYKKNKKNGGVIPPIPDIRVMAVPVGCQRCAECLRKKANEWRIRLQEEIREQKMKGHMVTLTFSEESLLKVTKIAKKKFKGIKGYELENACASIAVRQFTERWRKKYKKTVRHWLITELGHENTERLHLHGIIWTNEPKNEIEKYWKYGTVWSGYGEHETYVNEKTINYIIKYVTKTDKDHPHYIGKIYASNGMGKGWTKGVGIQEVKYKGKDTKEYYRSRQGWKAGLPIYYRNKAYTEEEREKLWIMKLDEEVRYVDGLRVDISKGQEDYIHQRTLAREKYAKLGYNGEWNWDEWEYEQQKRMLIREKTGQRTGVAYEIPTESSLIGLTASAYKEKKREIQPSKEWE